MNDGFSQSQNIEKCYEKTLNLSTTVAIIPAYAETDVNHHTPKTELSTQQADLSFAFDYKNPKRY